MAMSHVMMKDESRWEDKMIHHRNLLGGH
jgi:hypothetical protein